MYRDQAIELMVNTVENMNRDMAMQMNMPSAQIEELIRMGKPELLRVSALLYDTLYEHGVIN